MSEITPDEARELPARIYATSATSGTAEYVRADLLGTSLAEEVTARLDAEDRALTAEHERTKTKGTLMWLVRAIPPLLETHMQHVYEGECPGPDTGPDSRDPNCPACCALVDVAAALAAAQDKSGTV